MDSGNHYVAQVKGNQPRLYKALQQAIVEQIPLDSFVEYEKAHGRTTTWYVTVYNARNHEKASEWKNLSRFIHVHRLCVENEKETHGDRFYISDLYHSAASFFHQGIRGHWGVENRLHYVKDVVHSEDDNQIKTKNGPVNASTFSTIAINIHRKNGNQSIKYGQIKFRAILNELFQFIRN